MTARACFSTIWNRIKANQGEEFFTKRDIPFTYRIQDGDSLRPYPKGKPTNRTLSRSMVEEAWESWPVDGPGGFPRHILGPSYLWGLFSDSRISGETDGS